MTRGSRPDRGATWTLLACELRMLLRDRRTLVIAVVAPLVLFPLLILAMRAAERTRAADLAAAEVGWAARGERAAEARALVQAAAALLPVDSAGVPIRRFREAPLVAAGVVPDDSVAALLADGTLQLIVSLATTDSVPLLRLTYREDRERSRDGAAALAAALDSLNSIRRSAALRGVGLAPADELAAVETQNLASGERQGRALLGFLITPLFVLLLVSGGAVFAADAIAGEKERGTLETLLTTAARRADIVRAKQLAVLAVGIAITLINVANLLLYAGIGVIELPSSMALRMPPGTALLVLLLFLPVAALVSAVLLALSGFVRSYKEYQGLLFPIFVIFVVPAAACVLPGVRLRSAIAVVPIANISVAIREVLAGIFDVPFLALAFLSTTAAAAVAARLTTRALSAERLIAPDTEDAAGLPGPARFRRHLLRNFALLWAALFLVSLWTGDRLDLRAQVTVNLVVLFLGASLLMLRRYRLDARDALSLRAPRARVWLAVLVGAPSAYVTGIGLGQLTQLLFPVPERVLEAFAQYILPPDLPLWQVLFFLALLPGICEEIAFRGLLLHGLRGRLSTAALCATVGLVFGLFHVDLFRIIPTAYLGTILAAVVVLSGSIYPAILWHALNNATGLVPAYFGIEPEAPEWWMYALAAVGLIVAFWTLVRSAPNVGRAAGPGGGPPRAVAPLS
jgi:sodium transport system permease protein